MQDKQDPTYLFFGPHVSQQFKAVKNPYTKNLASWYSLSEACQKTKIHTILLYRNFKTHAH